MEGINMEAIKNTQKENKIIYFEILRIIAIFFVIFNHTGMNGYQAFSTYPAESFMYYFTAFISVFCTFAVPVFFALSGALLLKKTDEPINIIFRKRILYKFLTLIVISLLYYCLYTHNPFSGWNNLSDFCYKFYTKGIAIPLWFLYAYLGFLMILPLLRKLVLNLEDKHYYYIFAGMIIFKGVLPILEYLITTESKILNPSFDVKFFVSSITVYPLLGYFLHNRINIDRIKQILPTAWLINIAAIIITTVVSYYRGVELGISSGRKYTVFFTNFAIINCACLFMSTKYFSEIIKFKEHTKKIIITIGQCVFGIYLVHTVLLRPVTKLIANLCNTYGIGGITVGFIQTIIIFLLALVISLICLRVPFLKKLVQ